ncbi:MAG TPA: efflux RND transporter periplasmic adaptor subunit [Gemmatimonadaceae bacterium]|nr:efflux RND transporter periplasmic adaptor subunit [Gemmatimonadaceae bacterium]
MNRIARRFGRAGVLAPLVLGLLATACRKEEAAEEGGTPMVNATTGPVSAGPFRETISAIGAVVPRPGSVASLSAPAGARVASVLVVAGQAVKKGTPLIEFERGPFDARAASAEAALQSAERAHDRAQRLVEQGIAARKEEEQAAADLAKARADAIEARRDAQLAHLESPIDGVVTKVNAVLGATIDATQPVVEVADPTAFDVVANVTPEDAARIHPGARVTLASAAGTDGEALGTSDVRDVGGAVDPDTRGVVVRVRGATTRRPLRIGESVVADITVAEYAKAVTVPAQSLVPNGEGFKVFVVDEDGIAHEQPVTIGGRTKAAVRIVSGLVAGQIIVIDGAFGMTDGAKIAGIADEDDAPEPGGDAKEAAKDAAKGAKADAKAAAPDEKAGAAKKP